MWPVVAALALLALPAAARVVEAGPGRPLETLEAAMREARDGDTVRLAAGTYFECATVRQRDLVIEGAGDQTVLSDTTCGGKAILVLNAPGITVRNLVLARARVPDGNGAGIGLEAPGLTLERVRFENNQVGLLAGAEGGVVRVSDCSFVEGGVAGPRPSWAVLIDNADAVRIERSVFDRVKGGLVSVQAAHAELVGNTIGVGVAEGAGHAVLARGGTLRMEGNELRAGPHPPARGAMVLADGGRVELVGNRLVNGSGQGLTLLLDWSSEPPWLEANAVGPGDTLTASTGLWRNRVGSAARQGYAAARGTAGAVKRGLLGVVGR